MLFAVSYNFVKIFRRVQTNKQKQKLTGYSIITSSSKRRKYLIFFFIMMDRWVAEQYQIF